jgi:hypothetical protein
MSNQGTDPASKEERQEAVRKAFGSPQHSTEANPDTSQTAPGVEDAGESVSRRGEDASKKEQEPGRYSTGTDGAGRPTGESTPRDKTGVNPDEK